MSKPVLKSDHGDIRALDDVFHALRHCGIASTVRVLRFLCNSQGITAMHLFPEEYTPDQRRVVGR